MGTESTGCTHFFRFLVAHTLKCTMCILITDYDLYYPPNPIFYPEPDYIRRKRKSNELGREKQQPEVAYKVLKKRSKTVRFEDDLPDYMSHQEDKRIPDMLTPLQTSSNNRFFFPTRTFGYSGFGDESCRYDADCFGVQKCCHVQVSKYRFKLGCRHPRTGFF